MTHKHERSTVVDMTRPQLIRAAEAKLRDAENNLATCIQSMSAHKARGGAVLNTEVIALTSVQVALAQVYATLATVGSADD